MKQGVRQGGVGLRVIGAFKLASGLLLVALGVGLFRDADADIREAATRLISVLKLDPDNDYIHTAIQKVSGISPKQLRAISVGTFLYAMIYLVEGVGLLLKRHWAEYFTVFATGLFVPVELYEVAKRPTPIRVGVLALNVAIVAYLVYQIRRKDEAATKPPA